MPNWRDHFAGLRQSEWYISQVTASGAAQLLAGQLLDLNAIGLYFDPPDDFGGPCPRTPYDMNRCFLAGALLTGRGNRERHQARGTMHAACLSASCLSHAGPISAPHR